ncbi:hypothetical protein VTK73DRAFT_8911 [Phialemonium thermophilum]|uniref:Uncharacterized protein n=1 Tax=Phialemonium thermophilum TaxID=223376 RepID=A0ABR3W5F0_9PEZI
MSSTGRSSPKPVAPPPLQSSRTHQRLGHQNPFLARQDRLLQVPFLDECPMVGPPSCRLKDFKRPLLRKCVFDLNQVDWTKAEVLGSGVDGHVWLVQFGEDERKFALKAFWRANPDPDFYFAAMRESQNNAVLQMMETAVAEANAKSCPILVKRHPVTARDALGNMFAFCDEARQIQENRHNKRREKQLQQQLQQQSGQDDSQLQPDPPSTSDKDDTTASSGLVPIRRFPRMPKCYGWLKFNPPALIRRMPHQVRPQPIRIDKYKFYFPDDPDAEHFAIVYEYIEEGETDPAVVDEVAETLWLAGFCFVCTPLARNWRGNVLVDLSDIIYAGARGWSPAIYDKRTAESILI